MTFIPGWKTTVTFGGGVLEGSVVSLAYSGNGQAKPVFGSKFGKSLKGQMSATFSASGHVEAEKLAALIDLVESDGPVAFSIQVGTAESDTDAGLFSGNCNINDFTIEANADGEWDWSMSCMTDGVITFVPGAAEESSSSS